MHSPKMAPNILISHLKEEYNGHKMQLKPSGTFAGKVQQNWGEYGNWGNLKYPKRKNGPHTFAKDGAEYFDITSERTV